MLAAFNAEFFEAVRHFENMLVNLGITVADKNSALVLYGLQSQVRIFFSFFSKKNRKVFSECFVKCSIRENFFNHNNMTLSQNMSF